MPAVGVHQHPDGERRLDQGQVWVVVQVGIKEMHAQARLIFLEEPGLRLSLRPSRRNRKKGNGAPSREGEGETIDVISNKLRLFLSFHPRTHTLMPEEAGR